MFTQEQIAAICQQLGSLVAPLPPSVDGAQLLWAMSGNESSFGRDCVPRHEPAYDQGGVYGDGPVMQPLLAEYSPVDVGEEVMQSLAACSYGPWQLMFCNAPANATPAGFDDLNLAARWSISFLNSLLRRFQPQTLAEIGECWNGGHLMTIPSAQVGAYVHKLIGNYAVPMP